MNENVFDVEFEGKHINGDSKLRYTAVQVSEMLNIPVSTVRYYAQAFEDILDLEFTNKMRRFTNSSIRKLQYILKLKEDGMTVQQIQNYCKENKDFTEEGIIPADKPLAIEVFTESIKLQMKEQLDEFRVSIQKDIRNQLKDLLAAQYQINEDLKREVCVAVDEVLEETISKFEEERKEEVKNISHQISKQTEIIQEMKSAYVSMEEIKRLSEKQNVVDRVKGWIFKNK